VLFDPITSFGLPVAMTTGRLVVGISTGISTGLSGPAISAAAVAAGGLSMAVLGCLTRLRLRRRRASRHESSS
jgi:hypothetical protein